jgi:hypothetical protein
MHKRQPVAVTLVPCALVLLAAPMARADEEDLMKAARAAVCGPEIKGIDLDGHGFNVKPAAITAGANGATTLVKGQISHRLSWRPDDQVYYRISYGNGLPGPPEVLVDHGGVWDIVKAPLAFYDLTAKLIGAFGVKFTRHPAEVIENARSFTDLAVGKGWLRQVDAMVAFIGMTATDPDAFCATFPPPRGGGGGGGGSSGPPRHEN